MRRAVTIGVIVAAIGSVTAVFLLTETGLGGRGAVHESPQKAVVRILRGSFDSSQLENYAPKTIRVVLGVNNTVVWMNEDSAQHDVKSDTGRELDGPLMAQDGSWRHTFTSAGSFAYHCSPHLWMKGTVIVVRP